MRQPQPQRQRTAAFWVRHGPRLDHWLRQDGTYGSNTDPAVSAQQHPAHPAVLATHDRGAPQMWWRHRCDPGAALHWTDGDPPLANYTNVVAMLSGQLPTFEPHRRVELVSSPYRRCVETAYLAAALLRREQQDKKFGALRIDRRIGEVGIVPPPGNADLEDVRRLLVEKLAACADVEGLEGLGEALAGIKFKDGSAQPATLALHFSHKGRINLYEGPGTCRYSRRRPGALGAPRPSGRRLRGGRRSVLGGRGR